MSDFLLLDTFSLTPHRLSIYKTKVSQSGFINGIVETMTKQQSSSKIDNITKGERTSAQRFHNFAISESGRKRMILKINWLYFMSKSRYKKSIDGAEIHNFKINFITLTLPSMQQHTTAEITKTAFNQFLVEIREKYKLENYVWRLEFQKNGNVHYHIVTDCFMDFHIVQKTWNRCVDKLGYVQEYSKKHNLMTLQQYIDAYSNNDSSRFMTLKQRYFRGKQLNWQSPNSVDVKSVAGQKKIAFYISKYFSKKENRQNACNQLDNSENAQGLRLWFCSRSLSKLDKISDFVDAFKVDLLGIVTAVKDTMCVVHDYCTSYFFSFSSLLADGKAIIHQLLYRHALALGYKPNL